MGQARCNFVIFNIVITLTLIASSQSLPVQREATGFGSGTSFKNPRDLFLEYFQRTVSLSSAVNELLTSLNTSADPCNDFYNYACGHWADHHATPEGYVTWSNLYILTDGMGPKMQPLLDAIDSETDIEAVRKARKVYRACMNGDKIQEDGVQPLLSLLSRYGGWPLITKPLEWKSKGLNWHEINIEIMRRVGTGALFTIAVVPDPKHSAISRIMLAEPSLFIKKGEIMAPEGDPVVQAYKEYKTTVADILQKASGSSPELLTTAAQLEDLNNFERQLAEITEGDHNIKDIDKWYSLMTINDFQDLYDSAIITRDTAQINWLDTIRAIFMLTPEIQIYGSQVIYVPGRYYFFRLAGLLNRTPHETIVNYIMWKTITDVTLYLSDTLKDPLITFTGNRVGADPIPAREAECVSASQMELAVSYAYAQKYSSQQVKERVTGLVVNIQKAMEQYIRHSSWLDDQTKDLASAKIHHMIKSISYPDYYSPTSVNEYYREFEPSDSYFENELQKTALKLKEILRKVQKPTNKQIWPVEPTAVNAHYVQMANTILVPAGILAPPMFDLNKPSIFTYASIGPTIGHEVSHALDSEGRLYNENGDAVPWWSKAISDRYEQNADCFVNQYSSYKIYDDGKEVIHLNGALTLEENISDSAGLKITYDAYKMFREANKSDNTKISGLEKFTDDQIFFISFANTWCAAEDDKYLKQYANTDVHSPAKQRVNGAVSNNKDFASAFNCPVNSPMNPARKCDIWA
ncbi:endothelin-converting enzyme homolog [Diachasmimorpha longicaudata]|uniref:endothelin-converting enzyme homolog n=1 Tax=Diachasmimorpha longicaudata TaxID=58733 RepID=UPI0030B8FFD9